MYNNNNNNKIIPTIKLTYYIIINRKQNWQSMIKIKYT